MLVARHDDDDIGCHALVKEHSLPYYLPIVGGRTVGFINCARVFTSSENVNSLVEDLNSEYQSISFDDNHYSTRAANIHLSLYIYCMYAPEIVGIYLSLYIYMYSSMY